MNILLFDLQEVMALCRHALATDKHMTAYNRTVPGDPGPGLILVGDHGVYLMSNGEPGLMKEDGKSHVVAYAEGLNPTADPDDFSWYDTKRSIYGGDDGADFLPWAQLILDHAQGKPDATRLVIAMDGDSFQLQGVA